MKSSNNVARKLGTAKVQHRSKPIDSSGHYTVMIITNTAHVFLELVQLTEIRLPLLCRHFSTRLGRSNLLRKRTL